MIRHCIECGTVTAQEYYGMEKQHLVDGEYKQRGICLCDKCAMEYKTKGPYFYCFDCEGAYRASSKYQDVQPSVSQLAPVPCPDHSHDSDKPTAECRVCGDVEHIVNMYATKRGYYMCDEHMATSARCSAQYCQVYVHPDMDDVVKSGSNYYCPDCGDAKTVPDNAPSNYHPLSWDYRKGCPCEMCSYLAGRSKRWPEPSEIAEKDAPCHSCGYGLSTEHSTMLDSGNLVCHRCEHQHYFTCTGCQDLKHQAQYIEAVTTPPDEEWCKYCMKEHPDYWLCTVSCNAYFPNDSGCACGGVHKYNYSPEPEFQWAEKQEPKPHNEIPFLGFELEIEALGEGTSRPEGASLVRKMASDYGYLVHDGSLKGTKPDGTGGQHGFELVTHPFTYDWFQENWPRIEGMLRMLSVRGYRSWKGGRCGIHVHVSRAPMTDAHQMKFIQFIYGCTNLALCIGQRGYNDKNLNKFSPFHKEERSQLIQKVRSNMNPGIPSNKHYTAINTNKASTLEGRWFRGTLNPVSFRKNIEFMHAVWYFTKAYGFRSSNEINFIGWLDEPGQRNDYPMLREYLRREYITRR